jgi:hypothetical protein
MNKRFILALTLFSFNVCAQTYSQESNSAGANSSFNKTSFTNRTCIAMAEELTKMKSYVSDQPDRSVDYFKNKETYIKTAAEWIRVCGSQK